MRRGTLAIVVLAAALFGPAAPAAAVVPAVGGLEATNIQGVSALLKGTVDPEGLATSYRFEYSTSPSFSGAISTPNTSAGSGSETVPARAAIAGLSPSTTYHYRLVATNSSGTSTASGSFATTAGFGFKPGSEGFAAAAIADGGGPATVSSAHPYQLNLDVGLRLGGEFEDQPEADFPDGDLRDLRLEMPAGLIVNPSVLAECNPTQFSTPRVSPFDAGSRSGESCPDRSQAGTVEIDSSLGGGEPRRFGLFNLNPVPGTAAQLGFAPYGAHIVFDLGLRPNPDGSYALMLEADNVPQALDLSGLRIALWGTPWAASHNGERGNCLNEAEAEFPWAKCSIGEPANFPPQAYVTMPAACASQLSFQVRANAWQQPSQVSTTALNRDSEGQPAPLGSCASAPFDPDPEGFLTTTRTSSPSAFNFRLDVEDEGLTDPAQRAQAPVRKAIVRLPDGVTVNPSVGAGLGSCEEDDFEDETAAGPEGLGCPNSSKIGEFEVTTPLFDGRMEGAAYLAKPFDNPFDEMIAIYLVAREPDSGALVKLAGEVNPDSGDGDLTAVFDGLPQLPYTDLDITFHTGQRSFLVTPARCGDATTRIELQPWSGGASDNSSTDTDIKGGVGGSPCPSGIPPFNPGAIAGGVNSNVNAYTPYFVHLVRQDWEQEITSYSLILPKGITGKLAGIPFCPEAAIAAARANDGFDEAASPSCPAVSQVGRTLTGYGVGSALTYATGRIFLAGPHRGAPLSLVTVNSATVGPFDLGTVVVRSAFQVDPLTAQLRIDSTASDPIPHILRGIPLHLRDVRVYMDRPEFTHNPSSCEPSALTSTLTGSGASFSSRADDSTAFVSKHFQLLNCLELGFRPKLGLRLRGPVKRGGFPALRATFAARGPQDSNLKRIEVNMPRQLFLAQNHIRSVCTRVQFAADRCPPSSIYGGAVAYTPLLDEPLRGNVYLRSSSNKLPDLVTSLFSGAVRIDLIGRIGPTRKGGIQAFFDNLPDAPLDRFVMRLRGGRRGLLVNSVNICKAPPRATVKGLAQNNRGAIFSTKLRGQCKKGKRGKRGKGKRRKRARRAAISTAKRSER